MRYKNKTKSKIKLTWKSRFGFYFVLLYLVCFHSFTSSTCIVTNCYIIHCVKIFINCLEKKNRFSSMFLFFFVFVRCYFYLFSILSFFSYFSTIIRIAWRVRVFSSINITLDFITYELFSIYCKSEKTRE